LSKTTFDFYMTQIGKKLVVVQDLCLMVFGLLCSMFFNSALYVLAKRFQLHALSSRKKGWSCENTVLHKLQFFLSYSTVEFVVGSV